jgi:predicted ATPase
MPVVRIVRCTLHATWVREVKSLRLRLVNVGLVREATINLANLCIVMGPNNSGKSTVATALYSAIKSALGLKDQTARRIQSPLLRTSRRYRLPRARLGELADELIEVISTATSETDRMQAVMAKTGWLAEALLQEYAERFLAELEAGMGASLANIATRDVRGRRLPLKISIESESPEWSVEIRLRRESPQVVVRITEAPIPVDTGPLPWLSRRQVTNTELRMALSVLSDATGTALFAKFPSGAHYLPAARAGLLQSHRLVAAAMFQRSPLIGLGEVSMPSLSGVVADFVSEILLSEGPRESPFAKVAEEIERDVIHGRLRQVTTDAGYPEIEFVDGSGRYPIHRTSSMVSELAPIVLLLQRSVQLGDLLIIEEPESHLHPATQVLLARILVQASQRLYVFLTTHSDFFLSEINNLIRESQLTPKREMAATAAYWMDKKIDGSRLLALQIDPIYGIPEESFTEVAARLYDEQVDQQLKLTGNDQ